MAETVPIPEPPGLPLLGNLGEFSSNPISDIIRLADQYGMAVRSLLPYLIHAFPACLPNLPPYLIRGYYILTHLPCQSAYNYTFLTPTAIVHNYR